MYQHYYRDLTCFDYLSIYNVTWLCNNCWSNICNCGPSLTSYLTKDCLTLLYLIEAQSITNLIFRAWINCGCLKFHTTLRELNLCSLRAIIKTVLFFSLFSAKYFWSPPLVQNIFGPCRWIGLRSCHICIITCNSVCIVSVFYSK